ncbi:MULTISPECIES: hypothetical protein [Bacillus cereus group]|uniref:Uncharacterized protein n=2 Tax=Bacillus thuringiensis TaxID=1428 RepID=A0AAP4V2B4_BACTU|nr:hypothetical protein [Bacillus thuringiensis]AFV21947.1 hypothetical protein BTB_502p06420 [Bacillus thuringiensis Bt407]MEC0048479.1 hypothetical protein [Bacillus cereus]PQZ77744.1 hypothetical protein CQ064_07780 [Bacillus sp. MYb78]ERI00875.1 hypothetical protein BTCBT_002430 [Bacillus thuringiensis T01-328]MBN6707648.1 hypothetical protein [Bacillus thuringiensis]
MNVNKIRTIISILIPLVLTMLIVNFLCEVIPNILEGLPIFFPLIICPIGFILAYISYKSERSRWTKFGMVLNSVLFCTPFIWMIGGTMFIGA